MWESASATLALPDATIRLRVVGMCKAHVLAMVSQTVCTYTSDVLAMQMHSTIRLRVVGMCKAHPGFS